jgi:putative membrane protein
MSLKQVVTGALAMAAAQPIFAHTFLPRDHSEPFSPWAIDPVAIGLLVLFGLIYWRGSSRLRRRKGKVSGRWHRRNLFFWGGWFALVLALGSPLDPLGEELFSAHMVQHEVMMLIAGPLLVLSRPSAALLRGMPKAMQKSVGTAIRRWSLGRFWNGLMSPTGAWTVHAIGLWGWHIPFLFSLSVENTWVHALQHLSFLWISLIFWYALFRPRQLNAAVGVIYLFTTAIHASLLGALLTFSPHVWYSPYLRTASSWGLTALEDQQLGGLIMWMPAGTAFVVAGLWSLNRLMRVSDSAYSAPNAPAGHGGDHVR